jgi:hypothetical protein
VFRPKFHAIPKRSEETVRRVERYNHDSMVVKLNFEWCCRRSLNDNVKLFAGPQGVFACPRFENDYSTFCQTIRDPKDEFGSLLRHGYGPWLRWSSRGWTETSCCCLTRCASVARPC